MTPWWVLLLYVLLAWVLLWSGLRDAAQKKYAVAAMKIMGAAAWVGNFWRAP